MKSRLFKSKFENKHEFKMNKWQMLGSISYRALAEYLRRLEKYSTKAVSIDRLKRGRTDLKGLLIWKMEDHNERLLDIFCEIIHTTKGGYFSTAYIIT